MERDNNKVPTQIIELLEDLSSENLDTAELILSLTAFADDLSTDITVLRPTKIH